MRIGLCIRYFNPNYGGMLQGYATMKLLEKRNVYFELIRYEKKKDIKYYISSLPRLFNPILRYEKKLLISKKVNAKFHPEFSKFEAIRRKQFLDFEEKYFKPKEKKFYGYDALSKGAKDYDAVITGSDQIWSPSGLETNFYNLMFVPDEVRKISLASSFGVSAIPKNQIERTRKYLSRIPFISMRENQGAKIVKELTGRDVPVILDPVCMLSEEEWSDFASKREFCNEKYLFAYLMGDNMEYRKAITEYANSQGLKIVTLRHANQYVKADENFGDYWFYDVGPRDFLALINNAEKVCTDSYHGSVFSLIFHKSVAIFSRYNDSDTFSKNSRIDTLCKNYGIEYRRFSKNRDLNTIFNQELPTERIDKILMKGRREFDAYLDSSLMAPFRY